MLKEIRNFIYRKTNPHAIQADRYTAEAMRAGGKIMITVHEPSGENKTVIFDLSHLNSPDEIKAKFNEIRSLSHHVGSQINISYLGSNNLTEHSESIEVIENRKKTE